MADRPHPSPAAKKAARVLTLGSRGSPLAVAQSGMVQRWLEAAHPGLSVRLEIIHTSGDVDRHTRLDAFPAFGVFVKELQSALQAGRIDAAVHSLKDVPEEEPRDLVLAAFPEREDPRDVFVSEGLRFADLPSGAKVGTGSPRRVLQLRALRPDLDFVPIRGNVDTRLAKIKRGEAAGVVLAAAGLRRLGRAEVITHPFHLTECIPAIGQAALALECRADDDATRRRLAALNHAPTADAVTAERRFMAAVGGGCKVPMAAHVYASGEGFRLLAVLGDPDTHRHLRLERSFGSEEVDAAIDETAAEMLEECRARNIRTPRDL